MDIIEKNIDKIKKLCKRYRVSKLYIFGSVMSNHFTEKSDIDFLVSLGIIIFFCNKF